MSSVKAPDGYWGLFTFNRHKKNPATADSVDMEQHDNRHPASVMALLVNTSRELPGLA
jgi:hypothetical protein